MSHGWQAKHGQLSLNGHPQPAVLLKLVLACGPPRPRRCCRAANTTGRLPRPRQAGLCTCQAHQVLQRSAPAVPSDFRVRPHTLNPRSCRSSPACTCWAYLSTKDSFPPPTRCSAAGTCATRAACRRPRAAAARALPCATLGTTWSTPPTPASSATAGPGSRGEGSV